MRIDQTRSIGEIAATLPESLPLFEELGIDYYCHGSRQLREACEAVGLDFKQVIADLEEVRIDQHRPETLHHWSLSPLSELANHLISHYHSAARKEIARLAKLAKDVLQHANGDHSRLKRIETLLRTLADDIDVHIIGEEEHLFPQIEALERASVERTQPDFHYSGGIHNRILVEFHEHDLITERMRKIRELSSNFHVPESASEHYRDLMRGLRRFERELHTHLHLENNVLFPRAGELEHKLNK